MKKTKIFWHLLDLVFLIVFNLYFFLLKGVENPASVWISFASIHFAYLMLLITPFLVRKGSVSADYGRPLFVITTSYFFLALIVGVVFIIISPEVITVALLVQVTIAAIFAILLLTNLISNEHTADNIERHEVELKYVKESSSRLDALLKQISDNAIRKKVEKAYDLIHSSQVKSSHNVKSIEQDVISEIDNLEKALKQNNFENIQLIVEKICNLANDRNRQLKLLN
jgi:signal transduction histidine kinase